MSNLTGRSAEVRIQGTLLAYITREELQGLGELAMRTIRRELGKAGLDQAQHIDEVLQESLVGIFLKCQTDGKPIWNIRAYFITVCRNTARKYMEKVIRTRELEEQWAEAMAGQNRLHELPLDEHSLFLAALAKLSPQARRILEMMYIEGLDPEEIQAILRCRKVTWRVALHRARRALDKALKELLS
jgi:RNA polymerase sigma factor (sigma-70 family)